MLQPNSELASKIKILNRHKGILLKNLFIYEINKLQRKDDVFLNHFTKQNKTIIGQLNVIICKINNSNNYMLEVVLQINVFNW